VGLLLGAAIGEAEGPLLGRIRVGVTLRMILGWFDRDALGNPDGFLEGVCAGALVEDDDGLGVGMGVG
jgi:hypothetical protein